MFSRILDELDGGALQRVHAFGFHERRHLKELPPLWWAQEVIKTINVRQVCD